MRPSTASSWITDDDDALNFYFCMAMRPPQRSSDGHLGAPIDCVAIYTPDRQGVGDPNMPLPCAFRGQSCRWQDLGLRQMHTHTQQYISAADIIKKKQKKAGRDRCVGLVRPPFLPGLLPLYMFGSVISCVVYLFKDCTSHFRGRLFFSISFDPIHRWIGSIRSRPVPCCRSSGAGGLKQEANMAEG